MNNAIIISTYPNSLVVYAVSALLQSENIYDKIIITADIFSNDIDPDKYQNSISTIFYVNIGEAHDCSKYLQIKREYKCAELLILYESTMILNASEIKNLIDNKGVGIINIKTPAKYLIESISILKEKDFILCEYTQKSLLDGLRVEEKHQHLSLNNLNKREQEILNLALKGYSIEETASTMQLSKNTIAAYRSMLFKKVGCKSIGELIAKVNTSGIAYLT